MKPRGDIQLAIGYWIVSHRQQLRTWWAILLLGFIGLSLVWTAVYFSIFFAEQPALERGLAERVQTFAVHRPPASLTPQDLQPSAVTIIQRDSGHIDLLAFVKNDNALWGVGRFAYHFVLNEKARETQEAFINPNSERALIQLNIALTGAAKATLVIETIDWVRTGTAVIPTPNFSTDRLEVIPTTVTVGKQSIQTINLRATLTNRTVYNFLRIEVPIIVTSGTNVVAVDFQTLDRWPTLTARTVTSTWSYPIPAADSARIIPQVSQFDTSNLYR